MGIRGAERESENRRAEQKWRNGGGERGRGSEKRSSSRESEEWIRGAEQRSGAGAGNGAAEREWGLEERSAGEERRSGAGWGSSEDWMHHPRNQFHPDQFCQTFSHQTRGLLWLCDLPCTWALPGVRIRAPE